MQTLKTALVVTFLLTVLYVVYVTLNKPELAGEMPGLGDLQEWAGPDVELPDFSGDSAEPGPADLGDPGSAPGQYASPAATDYPLPSFDTASGGQPAPQAAPLASAYAGEVTAPPLSSAVDFPGHDQAEHEHAEHEHESTVAYDDDPTAEPASAYEASPYANTRIENVAGSEQSAYEPEAGAEYRPNDTIVGEATADESASRTALAEYTFKEAWGEAQRHLDGNKFARALATLTEFYRENDLTPEHRQQLLDMLDRLAGTVIYSTEHRLETPYEVKRGETLEQISQQYNVPSTLLFNINRSSISEPDLLLPGTQLKVMRGPFRAEVTVSDVDPSRGEATLFLGRLYAGRFPVTFGDDMPTPGREYQITERLEGKSYYQASGPPIEARSPNNPYGLHWLGFNEPAIGIHAISRHAGTDDRRGSIRLEERDAADVYGILSVGSIVKVLP